MNSSYFMQLSRFLYLGNNNLSRNQTESLRNWTHIIFRPMATSADADSGTNRLAKEKSPYLLQHATNPVDWFPWNNEAFEKAKSENKVIFLSVGYSTCHWCHVMERESFENKKVAEIMNQHFVNIKVDREERPDIDRVYMTFVQASTGSGGWPMSVWLTPDLKPIVGGTYFPPDDRYFGRPGFTTILNHIAKQWKENRSKVEDQGSRILTLLQESVELKKNITPSETAVHICYDQLAKGYDKSMGGFNESPKFPQPVNFNFLLRYYVVNQETEKGKNALKMVLHTLRMMARGGIHDHVSKGFHRYSTDSMWHVPHFEKMLYDQSQLCVSYLDAFQITKDPFFADIARDILEYVQRDLQHQSGGCYSAEDADSLPTADAKEKREGAFCVWTYQQVQELLGETLEGTSGLKLAEVFCKHFFVKVQGNVEPYKDPHDELKGQNVLMETASIQETAAHFGISEDTVFTALERGKKILYTARQSRPKAHLDDKMIAAWNGLMLSAFARAAQTLKDEQYVEATRKVAQFVFQHMYNEDKKQLIRSVYRGSENQVDLPENPISAVLDDYCCVIQGLLDAYEATFDIQWLEWAYDLQETQDDLFWDNSGLPDSVGGYFNSLQDDTRVMLRIKADQDGAEPSGNSLAVTNLARLGRYYDRDQWTERAKQLLDAFGESLNRTPMALPQMLAGFLYLNTSDKQIMIKGEVKDPAVTPFLHCINEHYDPFKTVLFVDKQLETSRLGNVVKEMLNSEEPIAVSICKNKTCFPPVTTVEDLRKLL